MDNVLFTEIESIVASWYYIADCNGRTESESSLIWDKLKKKYNINAVINWDSFLEKWATLKTRENIINSCKKALQNADYTSKLIALAGMWEIAESKEPDSGNSWTDEESTAYIDLESFLGIKREDVLVEYRSEKKILLNEVFQKLRNLYKEEKYKDAILLYESKIISTKHPVACTVTYLWALFNNSNEDKAYALGQDLLNKNYNDSGLIKVMAYITQWIGNVNSDILKLEESNAYFKILKSKDEIELNKGKIQILKIRSKQNNVQEKLREKKLKAEEKLRVKKLKTEEKNREKELIKEEKRKSKELKETQHKFKSTKGQIFCVYCGISKDLSYMYNYCDGRVNGHSYVFMKDKKGRLKINCKKCGATSSQSNCYCS